MGMGRKIWLTTLVGAILGLAIGYASGNPSVGFVYGIIVGALFGLWVDRKIRTRPPVG